MKNKSVKSFSFEKRQRLNGRMFVLPWVIGFVLFFLIPLGTSIWFSFTKVNLNVGGFETVFKGIKNYQYILYEHPTYTNTLSDAITSFLYSFPIILILSLCIAVVLNQNFKGRLVARAVYFIPAIVASGVVMQVFSADTMSTSMITSGGESNSMFGMAINFQDVFQNLGLPESITGIISKYVNDISNLIWSCGVQIILFLSGLQAIPPALYEASSIEGASPWEEFWFITFPMLSNVLIVTAFYTIIDIFTNSNNEVMTLAYNLAMNQQTYDISSAMLWTYFSVVGVVIGIIFFALNRFLVRRWN